MMISRFAVWEEQRSKLWWWSIIDRHDLSLVMSYFFRSLRFLLWRESWWWLRSQSLSCLSSQSPRFQTLVFLHFKVNLIQNHSSWIHSFVRRIIIKRERERERSWYLKLPPTFPSFSLSFMIMKRDIKSMGCLLTPFLLFLSRWSVLRNWTRLTRIHTTCCSWSKCIPLKAVVRNPILETDCQSKPHLYLQRMSQEDLSSRFTNTLSPQSLYLLLFSFSSLMMMIIMPLNRLPRLINSDTDIICRIIVSAA